MPLLIQLADNRSPSSEYIQAVSDCYSFQNTFWASLQPERSATELNERASGKFMSLLLGGFGIVTPTTAAVRFIASTKSRVSAALVGGLCAAGPSHMGACQFATKDLTNVLPELESNDIESALDQYCSVKPWPGFGHPVMLSDPRVESFFLDSPLDMLPFEKLANSITKKTHLKPNVDFIIGSMMSKHRVSPELGLLGFYVCRMPTLLAHYRLRYKEHAFGMPSGELREKYKKVPESWL